MNEYFPHMFKYNFLISKSASILKYICKLIQPFDNEKQKNLNSELFGE